MLPMRRRYFQWFTYGLKAVPFKNLEFLSILPGCSRAAEFFTQKMCELSELSELSLVACSQQAKTGC
jgi:hypothetical protein